MVLSYFRKNSVLVHPKTTTSYDMVENALMQGLQIYMEGVRTQRN
jgi:hypothetical protein